MIAAIIILSILLVLSVCANIIVIKAVRTFFGALKQSNVEVAYNDIYYPCKMLIVQIVPVAAKSQECTIMDFSMYETDKIAMITLKINEELDDKELMPTSFFNVEVYEIEEGLWTWRPLLH